jgi:hypothetical protein
MRSTNAKPGVGPDIDEAEVALFSARRHPLVAVTLERVNGAAGVLDGVCRCGVSPSASSPRTTSASA